MERSCQGLCSTSIRGQRRDNPRFMTVFELDLLVREGVSNPLDNGYGIAAISLCPWAKLVAPCPAAQQCIPIQPVRSATQHSAVLRSLVTSPLQVLQLQIFQGSSPNGLSSVSQTKRNPPTQARGGSCCLSGSRAGERFGPFGEERTLGISGSVW